MLGSISCRITGAKSGWCQNGPTCENMLRFRRPFAKDIAVRSAAARGAAGAEGGTDARPADTAIWAMALSRHPDQSR
ncbi:hypothetical protein MESS4_610024 [Mesorhizobium sp. STM 4661]|nr:hypothetical protein MESS4_610024 [Mesorhizobium sp. STM 4661]